MAGSALVPSPPTDRPATRHRDRRGRGRRWGRGAAALTCALTLACPQLARAEGEDERPWRRGTMVPTFGLGAGGFFSDIANVSFGLGFSYYIVAGLSAGLSFSDTILIYRNAFKARYPGIQNDLPTNIFDITPTLQYVFFRSRRFSPYVYAGVGPTFLNHGAGTFGQWVAGPGVYLNLSGPLYLNLGVGFSGLFPTGQCQDSLTYTPSDPNEGSLLLDLCSFRWGPQVGMVLAFGGGSKRRNRRRRDRDEPRPAPRDEPPSNPMYEAVEPEPAPPAADDAAPPVSTDVEPPPEEAVVAPPPEETVVAPPPEETVVAPPPTAGAPTDVPPPDVPPPDVPPSG